MPLMITGVIDGPLFGGVPKAIQLIATEDIADLSIYGLGSANNGGGTDGEEFTFPAVAVTKGTVLYVASEAPEFTNFFGFAPDYVDSVSSINGDDAIELFENGTVVDVFGEIDTDGTGQPWEYLDGWASRDPAQGPNATFTLSEWTFSGTNALDGETSNGTAASPFPIPSLAIPADLFISEYVEGSSNNKALEIFNGTGAAIDLTDYTIEFYFNGSTTPLTTIDLSGSVANNDVFVVADDGAAQAILDVADQTSTSTFYNGDDAIVLRKNGAVVDAFGQIGVDPGSAWPGGSQNVTLRRKDTIIEGDTDPDNAFDTSVEWDSFPSDTFDGLGMFGSGTGDEAGIAINELRISEPGADLNNFVELFTDPDESFDGKTLVVVSGEFAPGQIDFAVDLTGGTADEDGFLLIAQTGNANLESGDIAVDGLDFFGSPQTFLVVDNFTGTPGDDLDTDNDGTLDTTPWGDVFDSVSLIDADATPDFSYSDTVVPPDGAFPQAGAARQPDGTGNFVGLEFDDLTADTPGSTNTPVVAPPSVTIMEIQGAGHVSGFVSATPLDPTTGNGSGSRVTTTGIVTAVDSNGFYLQDPTGDGDDATSDAIFVFTGSSPTVFAGDEVQVEGTVSEFYPGGQGTGNLSTTQLSGNPVINVVSSGNALPTAVIIGTNGRPLPSQNIEDDQFSSFDVILDGIDFFESLEGMLVTADDPVAVSGTNRFGELFVVVDGGAGATGLSTRGTLNISPDDFNPERVQIDWDFGIEALDVDTGATFQDITGVVSYSFGNYEILPTQQLVTISPSALQPEVTGLMSSETELSVASYNVLNLDPVVENAANTGNIDDDVGNGRFDAIAQQIVNNLNAPDIIGLQEIQDNTGGEIDDGVISASLTFETLIDAIDMADDGIDNDSSGYTFIDNTFITDQASGGQPGGNIRTGFLYREDRVTLVENSVQTISGQASGEAFEGARLPLVATFEFNGEEITVVNNHFSSKGGSAPVFGVEQDFAARQEDVTVNGSLDERQRQSEAVQDFVTGLLTVDAEANVVVLGDFNEFEFVSPVLELETEAGLNNLTNTLDPNERYTFNFQGNSQSLDHILVSDALFADAQFDIVHVNSEFAETEQRASDHDPLVALFSLGPPPPELATVAVDFEGRGLFGSGFVESVDEGIVDSGRLPIALNTAFFDDVDVAVDAAAPGFELLTFFGGSLGVYSIGDRFFRGEATLVNDSETLIFDMEEGAFGDALVAMFEFATVFGNGDVEVAFFDDGTFLGNETFNAYSGPVSADFDGQRFDAVEISAVGDTAFSLSSFAFDRETFDGFDIV